GAPIAKTVSLSGHCTSWHPWLTPNNHASSGWQQSECSLLFTNTLSKHHLLTGRGRTGKFVIFLFVLIVRHVSRHQRIGFNFAEFALDQIAVAVRVFVHDHPI